jgi:hypothetical protein
MLESLAVALAALLTGPVEPQLAAAPKPNRPPDRPPAAVPAVVHAMRTSAAPALDGALDEPVWTAAQPIDGFVQRQPVEGAVPTERTVVRVAVDDAAIYIGAILYDSRPDSVRARLGRRDTDVGADVFTVFLDPYHDGRSGFYFGVNAAGTLYDGTLYNDEWDDNTWDGVWEAKTRRTSEGWTVEMRIPLSQLRFRQHAGAAWGINFKRVIARRNEWDYLVFTPRNGSGFVSRFPELTGMESVKPPARLEVLPYVTSRAEFSDQAAANPFNDGSRFTSSAGGDLKLGLGGNLTLDATVNPDFGQVEVDPAVVNLSDVETFFDEKRPFFIEGANTFNFGQGGANNFWGFNWNSSNNLFYSRRIGRAPQGSVPDTTFADVPTGTHILGASKLTGKVGSWNIGALSAVTRRESASLSDGVTSWRREIEPATYYGVARAQKEFAGGRQGLGVLGTYAHRFFDLTGDSLRAEIDGAAAVAGLDGWTFLDHAQVWALTGWVAASHVTGTPSRIAALEQNSGHYFQRPDAGYLHLDSTATALDGWAGRITLNKQKGNVFLNAALGAVNPGYEINDLGFNSRTDVINMHVAGGYRWTEPNAWRRSARLYGSLFRTYDFGGDRTWLGYWLNSNLELKNFWNLYASLSYNPTVVSTRLTRGGPRTLHPRGIEMDFGADGDTRHRFVLGWSGYVDRYAERSDRSWSLSTYVEWKPMDRLSVRLSPEVDRNLTSAQYVGTFADPLATATFGQRYVFADLDQTTLSASVRLNWIFTPRLSLELYAQPLVSSGKYTGFKELTRPLSYDFLAYGDGGSTFDPATYTADPDGPGPAAPIAVGNPNFTFTSLRGNAVMRWEYLPGSTLFLVWTQNRQDTEDVGDFRFGHSVGRLLSAKADNIFLVKLSYWWHP